MDPLFPLLPEDLKSLSDEEIHELLSQHRDGIRLIKENDESFTAGYTAPQTIEQLRIGVAQVKALRAELDGREAEIENYTATVDELAAEVLADESDEAEDAAEEAEEAADESAESADEAEEPAEEAEEPGEESVTASVQLGLRKPAAPAANRRVQNSTPTGVALRASGGLSAVQAGQVLDHESLRNALIEASEITSAKPGERTKVVVATAKFDYPEERTLGRNIGENADKIYSLINAPEIPARVASGGFCAPFPSFYDLPVVATAARPVRDALVAYRATRGGVSVPTPLGMEDVADGVGIVTNENDELGGTFATKNFVEIDCDPWTDYDVDAIYAFVKHGVLNARAWPERVDAVDRLLAAVHARVAETNLLNGISAGSTQVTDAAVYGAVSSMLQGSLKLAAAYRSRQRMSPEAPLRGLYPAYLIDALLADVGHGQFDRFQARSFANRILSEANILPAWYLDEETGTNQIYGAQSDGAALGFKTAVRWFLFDPGHWLFLDFGELNLGIIRDSSLAAQNDFVMFRETFEGVAPVGVESLAVTSTICPNGEVAAPGEAFTC